MAESTDARRISILEAATAVFSRYGFKKTSMDDLARAAGLSRQGLYLHFSTKEELFKAGLLNLVETMRAAGRAALAREDVSTEERLLAMFEAVHGHLIGMPGAEHMNELLEVANELLGSLVTEFESGIVADVARTLRSSGIAAAWKDAGVSAKELAENLSATSHGVKHQVKTRADYLAQMRIAVRIVCSRAPQSAP